MSSKKAKMCERIKNEVCAAPIRETFEGQLRFNTDELVFAQLVKLTNLCVENDCHVAIKRSGTGIVVIIDNI